MGVACNTTEDRPAGTDVRFVFWQNIQNMQNTSHELPPHKPCVLFRPRLSLDYIWDKSSEWTCNSWDKRVDHCAGSNSHQDQRHTVSTWHTFRGSSRPLTCNKTRPQSAIDTLYKTSFSLYCLAPYVRTSSPCWPHRTDIWMVRPHHHHPQWGNEHQSPNEILNLKWEWNMSSRNLISVKGIHKTYLAVPLSVNVILSFQRWFLLSTTVGKVRYCLITSEDTKHVVTWWLWRDCNEKQSICRFQWKRLLWRIWVGKKLVRWKHVRWPQWRDSYNDCELKQVESVSQE